MSRTIGSCMTPNPHTIGVDQPLQRAHEMMRLHRVRHLPVLRTAELVGLLSQRDLFFIETLKGVDPGKVTVEEAMVGEPYTVQRDAPIMKVVQEMITGRLGSAVVLDGRDVVGIFTAVDGLTVLHDLLVEQKTPRARRPALRAKAAKRKAAAHVVRTFTP